MGRTGQCKVKLVKRFKVWKVKQAETEDIFRESAGKSRQEQGKREKPGSVVVVWIWRSVLKRKLLLFVWKQGVLQEKWKVVEWRGYSFSKGEATFIQVVGGV